jgi:metal-responsive CopG/Arc/MetJ family transcriptional regulator
MKVKTSVTLSQELLEEIDHLPGHDNRSMFLEMAAWAYLEQLSREERERRDLEILNSRADYLNAEMADVLLYQVPL